MPFDGGEVLSKLRLDMDQFTKTGKEATSFIKDQSRAWEESVKKSNRKMTESTRKYYKDGELHSTGWKNTWMENVKGVQVKQEESGRNLVESQKRAVEKSKEQTKMWSADWWKRFGEVAVGFTLAYRAMNLIEDGLRRLVMTFHGGIQHIDDFKLGVIETAAALQILSTQNPEKMFKQYLKFAEWAYAEMEIIAVKHLATGENIQQAFSELATHGIVPKTREEFETLASLTDYILINTRGQLNLMSQIRTEIEPIVLGEKRRNAIVERRFEHTIKGFKDQLKAMNQIEGVSERSVLFFNMIKKGLVGVAAATEDILTTQFAWKSTLDVILKRVQRTGLMGAYSDILETMIKISELLMDENGLTEFGLDLAYKMNVMWQEVWVTVKGLVGTSLSLVSLWNMATFNLSPITNTFKGWIMLLSAVTTLSQQAFHATSALSKAKRFDFKGAREDLEKAKKLDEAWVADMEKLFGGESAFKAQQKLLEFSLKLREEIIADLRQEKSASGDAAKETKKWTEDVKDLHEEYKALYRTLQNLSMGMDEDEAKQQEEYFQIFSEAQDIPEKMREEWKKLKLDIITLKGLNKDVLDQRKEEKKILDDIEKKEDQKSKKRITDFNKSLSDWKDLLKLTEDKISSDERIQELLQTGVIDVSDISRIRAEFTESERSQERLKEIAENLGLEYKDLLKIYKEYRAEQTQAGNDLRSYVNILKEEKSHLEDATKLQTSMTDALEQRSIKAAAGLGMTEKEMTRMIDMLAEAERIIPILDRIAVSEGASADAALGLAESLRAVNNEVRQSVPLIQNQNLQLRTFARDAVDAQVRLLGGTQDIFKGAQVAQDEYIVNMRTWAEAMHDIISGEILAIEDSFVQFFKDLRLSHGNFGESLKAFWINLMNSIADVYIEQMTRMLVIKTFAALGGGSGTSGTVESGASYIPAFAHSGGIAGADILPEAPMNLNSKEYLTVLEKGEGVFTKAQMSTLGSMLSQEPPKVTVDIANFTSPALMDAYMASARGKNAVINVLTDQIRSIKRISGAF